MRAVAPSSPFRSRSAPFLIAVWTLAKSPFLADSKRFGAAYAGLKLPMIKIEIKINMKGRNNFLLGMVGLL